MIIISIGNVALGIFCGYCLFRYGVAVGTLNVTVQRIKSEKAEQKEFAR